MMQTPEITRELRASHNGATRVALNKSRSTKQPVTLWEPETRPRSPFRWRLVLYTRHAS